MEKDVRPMSWIANALIVWAWWAMGSPRLRRFGLAAGALGSFVWLGVALAMQMPDLAFIEALLGVLGIRALYLDWNAEVST